MRVRYEEVCAKKIETIFRSLTRQIFGGPQGEQLRNSTNTDITVLDTIIYKINLKLELILCVEMLKLLKNIYNVVRLIDRPSPPS